MIAVYNSHHTSVATYKTLMQALDDCCSHKYRIYLYFKYYYVPVMAGLMQ